jgi:RimJ/RimL family protein N-acetyltransferase
VPPSGYREAVLPFTFTPLRTSRLTLRLVTVDDVDDVFAYDSLPEVCAYLPYEPRSRAVVAERLETWSTATTLENDGDFWQVAIELPATTDAAARVIGTIYFSLRSAEHRGAVIGWVLHPDAHGRGFAAEAASAVLGLALGEAGQGGVGLHRVAAELDPRNAASIALCRRLGMREEAHFVKDLLFRGEWADTGIYAILAEEWAAR